jgi:thiol-disulfide isomerase/thioredoxin
MKHLLAAIFLIACVFSFSPSIAQKGQSDFEILKGKNDSDIVYRGALTFEDIIHVPAFHFEEAAAEYKPKARAIKALSETLGNYELLVFLGTWCPDSHHMIPELFKVLKSISYPVEKVLLHGLDREKLDKKSMPANYNITFVPTIIVLKDGKEIGRITEVPDKSVEQDLVKIINHR